MGRRGSRLALLPEALGELGGGGAGKLVVPLPPERPPGHEDYPDEAREDGALREGAVKGPARPGDMEGLRELLRDL